MNIFAMTLRAKSIARIPTERAINESRMYRRSRRTASRGKKRTESFVKVRGIEMKEEGENLGRVLANLLRVAGVPVGVVADEGGIAAEARRLLAEGLSGVSLDIFKRTKLPTKSISLVAPEEARRTREAPINGENRK